MYIFESITWLTESSDGLLADHHYYVAVETWNAYGQSLPTVARDVIPGSGTPSTPNGLKVVATSSKSNHLTWNAVVNAAGYTVVRRNIKDGTTVRNVTSQACYDDTLPATGTGNYNYSISAYNGNSNSAQGPYVMAPSSVSGNSPALCPITPSWCPDQDTGPEPEDPDFVSVPGADLVTVTTILNGKPTFIVETLGQFFGGSPDFISNLLLPVPITTTNSTGGTVTIISVKGPEPTGPEPTGAVLKTSTSIGPDGKCLSEREHNMNGVLSSYLPRNIVPISIEDLSCALANFYRGTTTLLVQTLFPVTTTNSNGLTITSTTTQGGIIPPPGIGSKTTTIVTTDSTGKTTSYTETLVRTTATNSNGSLFVGTITKGPTTTPTSYMGLITYTELPPSISTYSTSVSHNTHDSGGFPVLGPWPGCWFCPPGSHGIQIHLPHGIFPGGG